MDEENENMSYEMQDLDNNLKNEREILLKLKEDYLNKIITHDELVDRIQQSMASSKNHRVILDDIADRIETGDEREKN
ncbi:MAG: hypothetical protein GY714_12600 [Desulfobacterales bacterium]|nr:hypothetical protein [Desulfobacterales bacterium]MCP4163813.1 hypothetical protein [Deltaproteobacteria bacterium]